MVYFDQVLHTYYLFILILFGMHNGDDALSSIIFGRSRYFSENAHNFERHVIHVF